MMFPRLAEGDWTEPAMCVTGEDIASLTDDEFAALWASLAIVNRRRAFRQAAEKAAQKTDETR